MAQSEKTAVGRIIKGLGGLYDVMDENGIIYKCKARGIFRLEKTKPLVGDIATLKFENDTPFIYEINERKNTLIRPPMANLEILFCSGSAAKKSHLIRIKSSRGVVISPINSCWGSSGKPGSPRKLTNPNSGI